MSNDIKLFSRDEFGELEVLLIDGKEYFPASDVAKVLGYSNPRDALNRHCKKDETVFIDVKSKGGVQKKKYISKNNVKMLVSKSRLLREADKKTLLITLGGNEFDIIVTYHEVEWLSIIQKSFINIKSVRQYRVGNYKVDLYFPELNLAIECDEYGHASYNKTKEARREEYISDRLRGCTFVRFNPNDASFNIGDVLFKLNQYVHKNNEVS